ncbi:GNAT family N-acetyltransferase [Streptococcus uberis]|uniref:GNAT family N-acetyltransferase n=1 Tax=Streptococcus uberis TaxID=1349 RepID=UPI001FF47103|nr:GNAT family N-acetyltransferase [Streptococcus uberis]MCK1214679.1 GNAT family N-acetyltransferase [Streptococcus uberis]
MYKIISLDDLINALGEDTLKTEILPTFKSISEEPNDIESFLHNKSISFEKTAIASTYLVFQKETNILVGFFSLANKPLTMSKRNFEKLSNSQKRKLTQYGRKIDSKFQINSYLIGQLGKNYSTEAMGLITGNELLTLAFDKVVEASTIIRAKYVWLECENNPKLVEFYKNFGFSPINNYISENGLTVMILKLK